MKWTVCILLLGQLETHSHRWRICRFEEMLGVDILNLRDCLGQLYQYYKIRVNRVLCVYIYTTSGSAGMIGFKPDPCVLRKLHANCALILFTNAVLIHSVCVTSKVCALNKAVGVGPKFT